MARVRMDRGDGEDESMYSSLFVSIPWNLCIGTVERTGWTFLLGVWDGFMMTLRSVF